MSVRAADAIVDTPADVGMEHREMPVTPARLWRAIRPAGEKTS